MQVGFGLGRHANRNVLDGFGGVSRPVRQLTVQASRGLSADFDTVGY